MPGVVGERAARVIFYRLYGYHGDCVTDFNVMQFPAAFCKGCVEQLREGTCLTVIYPVTVLYEENSFFRRPKFLLVYTLIIHLYFLLMVY